MKTGLYCFFFGLKVKTDIKGSVTEIPSKKKGENFGVKVIKVSPL